MFNRIAVFCPTSALSTKHLFLWLAHSPQRENKLCVQLCVFCFTFYCVSCACHKVCVPFRLAKLKYICTYVDICTSESKRRKYLCVCVYVCPQNKMLCLKKTKCIYTFLTSKKERRNRDANNRK